MQMNRQGKQKQSILITRERLQIQHLVLDPQGAWLKNWGQKYSIMETVQEGGGRVYTQRDLLLDQGGGESGERLEDELGLVGVSAGQTPAWCGS